MLALKIKLIEKIKKEIEEKIQDVQKNYELAKESRNSDTKSSAGDKYETGREMVQREMDKLEALLKQYQSQLHWMNRLEINPNLSIQNGSMVRTTQGMFFIGLGLGKIMIDETTSCFAISLDSPIGAQLKGKQLGAFYEINGKTFEILEIL